MKSYQKIIAIGLTTLLPYSLFGKDKKDDVKYPTRTECNKILNTNPGLITAQYHYCMGTGNFNTLLLLAKDPCASEASISLTDPSMEEKIKHVFNGADTEDPKYIITPTETLNYQKQQREFCLQNAQNLEKEVSASSAAPVAGNTIKEEDVTKITPVTESTVEYKEAKKIPKGMVGVAGYTMTPKTERRLYVLTGVRAGEVDLVIANGTCTPSAKSFEVKDEDLAELEQILIEADAISDKTISDEEGVAEQLKLCCKQDPESNSCKK